MNDDPLDKFIVSKEDAPDSNILASCIGGFLRFTKDGEMILDKPFSEQPDWKKVMLVLLGRKVISIKNLKVDFKEEITPKELFKAIGVPQKSITKILSVELKGLTKSEKGAHKIPNYNLHKCEELLKKKT